MSRRRYPSDERVRHTVALARELGLKVAGIKIGPDGSITTIDSKLPAASAVDRWFAQSEGQSGEHEQ